MAEVESRNIPFELGLLEILRIEGVPRPSRSRENLRRTGLDQVPPVNKTTKASQIDESTPAECAVRIEIPTLEDFAGIKQGVNDSAFPCAVWAEEERNRLQDRAEFSRRSL